MKFNTYYYDRDPANALSVSYIAPYNMRKHTEVTADDCYIEITVGGTSPACPKFKTYQLSLTKPEYREKVWGERIMNELKEPIVKCIKDSYRPAIWRINSEAGRTIVDSNCIIPEYKSLETENDSILKQYLDFYLHKLVIPDFDEYFFDEEGDYFSAIARIGIIIRFVSNGYYYYPEVNDDEHYILVTIIDQDTYKSKCYRISLYEPKYVYNSDDLPEDDRDLVIKTIIKNYKEGLQSINNCRGRQVLDPNRPIPDYNLL
jgi:hypothetical protein